jgi:RNA polymerase sigma-70 factor (ECF subfamily)
VGEDAISDEFLKRHYAGLQLLLRRRIKDAAVAADLLNEAIATAMTHMRCDRIAEPDKLAGYVYRVALNLYRNYRREFDNRADIRVNADDIDHLPGAPASHQDFVDPTVVQQVREVIKELPTPRDREIVTRFYLDEEEKSAICESLGVSPLHFDKVAFRARQRMRALLEARGFDKRDLVSMLLFFGALACDLRPL